ncbi:OLC1v1001347C6 [Oldenlandia corymbosa var. corymbosa]|uniref:OLC1v1001347C6 n=1 Tax=Oldenlandia corymbosa var. corymbosa TaxID=529605 RepID=A0AAV1D7C6_OLDCO|nr:OLC1v1001347C6 [Oldenlandia corymbosa var. corymbosa]
MGASRKLQGEIDRVLKKVQEGVDVFDSIWNKVYDTDNANQKEKFEADLKKEIKKLQRYRDQIKTWIQSSEIKDKKVSASYEQALMDARKLIEKEMERFKICEKETKTKAFSKEGLGQQPKTDPKEKAKSETRDWLNNVVSELENQIDSFEAEMEGLSVKKGKQRPPRLTHLEASITRHKAHIMKLELILRLLDNDELSPEQVNDVKDFLDDYVERNQEDFDEFSDVDELYSSLPLEKVESLEDLVTMGPPALVKGGNTSNAALSMKNHLATPSAQAPASVTTSSHQGVSAQELADETASHDSNPDVIARTPPPKTSPVGSAPATPVGSHATPGIVKSSNDFLGASTASSGHFGTSSSGVLLDSASVTVPSSPVSIPNSVKEEDITCLPGRKASPAIAEAALRGVSRGGFSNSSSSTVPLTSGSAASSNSGAGAVTSGSEIGKKIMLGGEERLGSSGMVQPLISPMGNRMMMSQGPKTGDAISSADVGNAEAASMGARMFSSSVVPGMQWRPGSSFQNQNELGQFRGRTEIAPDQREKFLQRFQQVQQGQNNLLGLSLAGGSHKPFSVQQQNPLSQQQQPSAVHLSSNQATQMLGASRDADAGHAKVEELHQQTATPEDSSEFIPSSGHVRNLVAEDNMKASYGMDSPAAMAGNLTESSPQMSRDVDLSPGQPLQPSQPSGSLGVIGRRSVADLGAIGDNLGAAPATFGGTHDQNYNYQMLEAAYYKLPQPKDSERAKNYTPRHPVSTPLSYPQVQAPIVNNPAFWERLGADNYGTDTLFFAFYYQQNTYQQYLAAKELKKQSWRYHRKYNTWFQRHKEPEVATDDFEQGTYVYFDFHIANDEQHGWCQRIKTEFTFEYNYLEDELIV